MILRELRLVFKFRAEANAYQRYMTAFFRGSVDGRATFIDPYRIQLEGLRAGEARALAREVAKYGGQVEVLGNNNEGPKEETHV